jgi:hypothetical protein
MICPALDCNIQFLMDSKGVNGGTYRYFHENVGTGTSNVYRITEKEGKMCGRKRFIAMFSGNTIRDRKTYGITCT